MGGPWRRGHGLEIHGSEGWGFESLRAAGGVDRGANKELVRQRDGGQSSELGPSIRRRADHDVAELVQGLDAGVDSGAARRSSTPGSLSRCHCGSSVTRWLGLTAQRKPQLRRRPGPTCLGDVSFAGSVDRLRPLRRWLGSGSGPALAAGAGALNTDQGQLAVRGQPYARSAPAIPLPQPVRGRSRASSIQDSVSLPTPPCGFAGSRSSSWDRGAPAWCHTCRRTSLRARYSVLQFRHVIMVACYRPVTVASGEA